MIFPLSLVGVNEKGVSYSYSVMIMDAELGKQLCGLKLASFTEPVCPVV